MEEIRINEDIGYHSSNFYSQIREAIKILLQFKEITRLEENSRFIESVNMGSDADPSIHPLISAYHQAKYNYNEFIATICSQFRESAEEYRILNEMNGSPQNSNLDDSFYISRPDSEHSIDHIEHHDIQSNYGNSPRATRLDSPRATRLDSPRATRLDSPRATRLDSRR
jgi:hypothetical protein